MRRRKKRSKASIKRYRSRPKYKRSQKIRAVINDVRKKIGIKKYAKIKTEAGWTVEEFEDHIESQFEPGMNWGADIHIDHIIPLRVFKTVPMDVVNNLANLRPMWASQNLSKGAKFSLCNDLVQKVFKDVPEMITYIRKPYIKRRVTLLMWPR